MTYTMNYICLRHRFANGERIKRFRYPSQAAKYGQPVLILVRPNKELIHCLSFKSPEADVIVPIVTTLGGATVPGAIPLMNAAT